MKKYDFLCVGELLVNFVGDEMDSTLKKTEGYSRFQGGNLANLAVNLAGLGWKVALVASVGNDGLGEFLVEEMRKSNVDISCIEKLNDVATSLVIASRSKHAPEFIAYRQADYQISAKQLHDDLLSSIKVFHTSCFALSKEPARSVIMDAASRAFQFGATLSIDLNFSDKIWTEYEQVRQIIEEYCAFKPLVKVSLDNIERIYGKDVEPEEVAQQFLACGSGLVCITLGAKGSTLYLEKGKSPLFVKREALQHIADATGAGDAYWSGFLTAYLKEKLPEECGRFASKIAALKLQTYGSLSGETLQNYIF